MKTVTLDVYAYNDLLKYLERLKVYIKTDKKRDSTNPHDRWDNTRYDVMKIDRLIGIIEGRIYADSYIRNKPPKVEQVDDDKDDLFSFLKG